MPEGHTIHRAARDQRRILVGQHLHVSSPQGRFTEGAARLDGQRCLTIEAHGKHLLYEFAGGDALHLHLGLFGRIRQRRLPPVEPRGAVRVRLIGATHLVDVSGPTICRTLDPPGVAELIRRLGPDVLRPDADPESVFRRIARSRAPIGRLIMDQSVLAGVGNIYRTEILWRQGVHPERPGRTIDRATFDRIWRDATTLLARGVERNAIVTTADSPGAGRRRVDRLNIFGRTQCPTCGGPVRRLAINGRRAFVCDQCQRR